MMADAILKWIDAVAAKFGLIIIGLLIGTAAKYGLLLTDGKRLTFRAVATDVLLLGMLGLLAIAIADWLHLQGNARVMCGALAAVSSDRLIRLARDRFLKNVEGHIQDLMPDTRKEAMFRIPAGIGEPDSVAMEVPAQTPAAQMGSILRKAYRKPAVRPPEDQIELLRRLDRDDV